VETGDSGQAGLAVRRLEEQAEVLLRAGIAQSTEKTYSTAQRGYLLFCQRLNLTPLPATEDTLILFATELAQARAYSTIKTYLAGVRHLHVIHGLGNPLEGKLKLGLVLKGINRVKPRQNYTRLPVTPLILSAIKSALEMRPGLDSTMLWAACCMGFFGFMRSGEFTIPASNAYDSNRHLSVSDIAVDSHTNPTMLSVRLRVSKTDPFGAGVTIYLGRTSGQICPVAAVLQYLAARPPVDGPLFITEQGAPLTKAIFITRVREALSRAGIDSSSYKGHSFRIGAATTAAACGMNEGLIKTLGRWASSAYQTYIRIPPADLANISARLVN
jgi:hypothetical protein